MNSRNLAQEDSMSIADRNLVDELSSGDVTMQKLGKVCAAIYLQVDVQGTQLREIKEVTEEHTEKLEALQTAQNAQKIVSDKTLEQTKATNGRVTKLEDAPKVVGCPGKCITLAEDLEREIARAKEQEVRLQKLEEPIKVRGAIWHGIVSSFTGVSAVLAVIFGFLCIPGVSDHLFKSRDEEVARIVQAELSKAQSTASATPAPATNTAVTTTKKP